MAVYLVGSVALGCDGPSSDVDVVVVTDQPVSNTLLGKILQRLGVVELCAGRDLDPCVVEGGPMGVMDEPLIANSLRTGRLLAGTPLWVVPPLPAVWAWAAAKTAVWSLDRNADDGDPRSAVTWAAGARVVAGGAPIPVGKHAAGAAYLERIGGKWAPLVAAALAREVLDVDQVAEFIAAA